MLFPYKGKYTPLVDDPPAKRPRTDPQPDPQSSSSGPSTTTGTILTKSGKARVFPTSTYNNCRVTEKQEVFTSPEPGDRVHLLASGGLRGTDVGL